MRLVTWNVRHARPRRGFASNRSLTAAIASFDADVLAVQEVDRRVIRSWFADQPSLVAAASNAASWSYADARRVAIIGTDGIALCVRSAAVFRTVRLPHRWGQRRVAVIGECDQLTIVTTHLQNEANEARHQLGWLLEELDSLARPCVLLGDLNLRPDDVEEPLRAAGFVLANGAPTEPAWAPNQRIDHVAVAGATFDSVVVGDAPVSDHRPVIAEVTF